ncbi:hypothetical protein GLAREA_01137 [Glarea lozoyensis ATCC 20868]|uniref:Uncharacterized protein n=1 Tax=Glarea lozoyensis (strain ATCC 20868 / MF5171) TaxID=1116229 RepID=S3CU88_GLAL2|nr:uncharacterized protein GLAREA_01137 [Glarea lozoyensis ATCC 20868]EPE29977.1 hypothetical protein GLAREA_01137 [Glarea lozoyensis ATCC 20868]
MCEPCFNAISTRSRLDFRRPKCPYCRVRMKKAIRVETGRRYALEFVRDHLVGGYRNDREDKSSGLVGFREAEASWVVLEKKTKIEIRQNLDEDVTETKMTYTVSKKVKKGTIQEKLGGTTVPTTICTAQKFDTHEKDISKILQTAHKYFRGTTGTKKILDPKLTFDWFRTYSPDGISQYRSLDKRIRTTIRQHLDIDNAPTAGFDSTESARWVTRIREHYNRSSRRISIEPFIESPLADWEIKRGVWIQLQMSIAACRPEIAADTFSEFLRAREVIVRITGVAESPEVDIQEAYARKYGRLTSLSRSGLLLLDRVLNRPLEFFRDWDKSAWYRGLAVMQRQPW